jgi:hypothetical protein
MNTRAEDDQLIDAVALLSDAAAALMAAAEKVGPLRPRLGQATASLYLAADNLVGHVLGEVTCRPSTELWPSEEES